MGKHRTGTEGVVEARNRSRFPDSSAGPGDGTSNSALGDATEGVDEEESSESTGLSASTDSEVTAAGAGIRLADRGEGDGESEGDDEGGRRVCRPCCSWCWRRWGG